MTVPGRTAVRRRSSTSDPKRLRRTTGPGPGKYDRKKTSQQRREETRIRMLDAAASVFAEFGYAHASLNEIVARAGVSKRTFYEHFDDLKACLLAVYDHAIRAVSRDLESRLRQVDDPIERLTAGVEGYLSMLGRNAALALVLHREASVAPEFAERRRESHSRWQALLVEGLTEAHERGLGVRTPDELTAYAIVGAMESVALRYVALGQADRILEAAPALVNLTLRAFAEPV